MGLITDMMGAEHAWVQLGTSGPFKRLKLSTLRLAYPQEIAAIMGCRPEDLDEAVLRRAMALE